MPKPAKPATKRTTAKANSIEALKAKAEELARLAEAAEDSLREAQHREIKPQTPEEVEKSKKREAFYQKHKKAIDKALELCTGHLKQIKSEVALETIRRLEAYYLRHGTSGPGNIGRKIRPLI